MLGVGRRNRAYREPLPKEAVMALVERGGQVRSFHLRVCQRYGRRPSDRLSPKCSRPTRISGLTKAVFIGRLAKNSPATGRSIMPPIEYVRGDAYTNTIDGYFSILKRGIYGVYHHVSQEHLKAVSRRVLISVQRAHCAGH